MNTALIGLGMVANTHVQAITGLNGKVRLKGVFARGQQTAKEYAIKAGSICGHHCKVYSSIETVANDPELDFVIIATPPNARIDLIKLLATTANYPSKPECITLHFDHAVARLERAKLHIFWRDGKTNTYGEDELPVEGMNGPMDFKSTWHGGIISDFADAVTTGKAPMVTGREGLKVHRFIDALLASSEQKKTVSL